MAALRRLVVTAVGALSFLGALGWSDSIAADRLTGPRRIVDPNAEPQHAVRHAHLRRSIDGSDFPEGVVALTWDDGPDLATLDLARYLRRARIAATFFVVRTWSEALTAEPGRGPAEYETGYSHLPVLGELVALGHRLGNHTDAHVVLAGVPGNTVVGQLGRAQAALDPFLANELRMFRAPGGYFDATAAAAIDAPAFAATVGPIRWDVDAKDWECSLYCRSSRPAEECERAPSADPTRVKPSVVAARYVAAVDRAKRGIVLLHDRVGDVGSRYALDVAEELVPALEARGYVFAAPVLAFGPLRPRLAAQDRDLAFDAGTLRFADLDGDGRADLCGQRQHAMWCARSFAAHREDAMPHTAFAGATAAVNQPNGARDAAVADVDGDGRADVCWLRDDDVGCARAKPDGELGAVEPWGRALGARGDAHAHLLLADVDGDRRIDACVNAGARVVCAIGTGARFGAPRPWADGAADVALADVDGDGRADACARSRDGIACARSSGRAFAGLSPWSTAPDLARAEDARFGDLNGDGRADVCAPSGEGVACALSNGRSFTAPVRWLADRVGEMALGDVNGDGRADLCGVAGGEIACALAP